MGAGLTAVLLVQGSGGSRPDANSGDPNAVATFVGWEIGTAERIRTRFENVVGRCMESKDLPYAVPEPAPRRTGGIFGVPLGLFGTPDRPALEDYKRRSGYGIASQFDELRLARTDNAEMRRNTNADYLAGLRPELQQRWTTELEECRQRADTTLNPDPAVLDRLENAYARMEEHLASDPRYRRLQRRWAACLKGKGFPFSSEEEIRGQFLPQLARVAGGTGRQTESGFVLGVRALDSAGNHAGDEFADIDRAALERLRDREMAIARADLSCQERLRPEADALRSGYEAAFIAEHRADLEAVRDRWRQPSASVV